jgi:hypothetical protein
MFQAWLVKIAKIAAHSAPSREPQKESDSEGKKSENRNGLKNVEQGNEHHFGAAAFCGERRVNKGEDQRNGHRREHPQRRAKTVIGKLPIIEREICRARRGERRRHLPRAVTYENEQAEYEDKPDKIPNIGQRSSAERGECGELIGHHEAGPHFI